MLHATLNSIPHVIHGWKLLDDQWKKSSRASKNSEGVQSHHLRKSVTAISMLIYSCAIPVLSILDLIYTSTLSSLSITKKDGDCENFFSSNMFCDYKSKLAAHLEISLSHFPLIKQNLQESNLNHLNKLLTAFVDIIQNNFDKLDHSSQRRAWFKKMTQAFRDLVHAIDNSKDVSAVEIRHCLEMWIYKRYIKIEFIDEMSTLHAPYSKDLNLNHKVEFNKLETIYYQMVQDRTLQSNGSILDLFDAHSFGNVPFSLPPILLPSGQSINMIRMPSVTKDICKNLFNQKTSKVSIIEEFNWFLNSLAAKKKCHFYVNLMDRTSGNEAIRSHTIEQLEESSKPIRVLTLDKDSSFYKQTNAFKAKLISVESFKLTFLNQILKPHGRFYLPKGTSSAFVKEIIENTHHDHYAYKIHFERNERLNFIEIVYCRLIEALAIKHEVSSMNISCKHCIDRGASQNYIFMNYMRSQNKTNITDDQLLTLLFTPAIMVANRPIREHYLKRASLYYKKLEART